jgi:threonine/homoserine/homoserine lactone efflux protein
MFLKSNFLFLVWFGWLLWRCNKKHTHYGKKKARRGRINYVLTNRTREKYAIESLFLWLRSDHTFLFFFHVFSNFARRAKVTNSFSNKLLCYLFYSLLSHYIHNFHISAVWIGKKKKGSSFTWPSIPNSVTLTVN